MKRTDSAGGTVHIAAMPRRRQRKLLFGLTAFVLLAALSVVLIVVVRPPLAALGSKSLESGSGAGSRQRAAVASDNITVLDRFEHARQRFTELKELRKHRSAELEKNQRRKQVQIFRNGTLPGYVEGKLGLDQRMAIQSWFQSHQEKAVTSEALLHVSFVSGLRQALMAEDNIGNAVLGDLTRDALKDGAYFASVRARLIELEREHFGDTPELRSLQNATLDSMPQILDDMEPKYQRLADRLMTETGLPVEYRSGAFLSMSQVHIENVLEAYLQATAGDLPLITQSLTRARSDMIEIARSARPGSPERLEIERMLSTSASASEKEILKIISMPGQ